MFTRRERNGQREDNDFQGGYEEHDKFYFFTRQDNCLEQKQDVAFIVNGTKIEVRCCSLLRRRMLFLGNDGVLYGGVLGTDIE